LDLKQPRSCLFLIITSTIISALTHIRTLSRQAQPAFNFNQIDKDGDGRLTREEYNAAFDLLDADKDGKITKEEFNCVSQAPFALLDIDGDGFLSRTEFEAGFDVIDTDKDLSISRLEFQSILAIKTSVLPDVQTPPKPLVVFVLGGPGAGKGTQCARIVKKYGWFHLSAGDLLRAETATGSADADLINSCIKEGKIVPVEVTVKLLLAAMQQSTTKSFLVDGFPRSVDNYKGWCSVVGDQADVACCLFYECGQAELERRLLDRGKTSGRDDDNIESIKKRFVTFTNDTSPVVEVRVRVRARACVLWHVVARFDGI
jgi:UMP-CMP kinase